MCWELLYSINLKIELGLLILHLLLIIPPVQLLIMVELIIIMIHTELILNQYMLNLVVRDSSNQISQSMIRKRPHLLMHKIQLVNCSEVEKFAILSVILFKINMWQWFQFLLRHMMMILLLIHHRLIYI